MKNGLDILDALMGAATKAAHERQTHRILLALMLKIADLGETVTLTKADGKRIDELVKKYPQGDTNLAFIGRGYDGILELKIHVGTKDSAQEWIDEKDSDDEDDDDKCKCGRCKNCGEKHE